ncbi:MAG: hypothetical protein RLZZ200_684 [Pseudomonadota bacterium]|jgi:hypothetical protein
MHATTLKRFDPLGAFWALILFMATVITHAGLAVTTNLVSGLGGTVPKYIGWGTGVGTADPADTTLFAEKLVDLATAAGTDHTVGTPTRTTTDETNDTLTVTGTRTASGAGSVTNAGLFDAASGGTLFCKGDFTSIGLASGDSIQFTFRVQFA